MTTPDRQSPQSVLQQLQARAGSRLGVHLPDAEEPSDAPVKVTEEAQALRDPAGRYQLLGEIGRGGVGIVYKGRDQDLGRDVAMKVLKDEYAGRGEVLARFVEEAQIGGQLQHPGIVPVYELGLQAGERPYFAMKLVKGETLAAHLLRRGDPSHERRRLLGIFEQVCQTMAYAHSRRVVHRDLKPANVMIGAFGEVQVVDWGFAKVLAQGGVADESAAKRRESQRSVIETVRSTPGSGSHSVVGSMMGTPPYMPPEQAQGDIERVDERSDVFALGAILCEILTGEPPYRERDGDLVVQAASGSLDGAYERLKKSGADEALVTLCTQCLMRAQRARPASAGELAKRISAYLTSVEERARKAELRATEARFKHRVTLLSAAAGLVVLAVGAGAWTLMAQEGERARAAAAERMAGARSAASGALGQAQAGKLDLNLWSAAVASAEQLVALAKSEEVAEAARADAEKLLARVQDERRSANAESDRRARHAAMIERLGTLRLPIDDDLRGDQAQKKELRRLDTAYAEAFSEYLGDTDFFGSPKETVLTTLQRGDIAIELAASLDHWGLVRNEMREAEDAPDAEGTARIEEIARLLDPDDPWRRELRALLPKAKEEGAALRALADEADFAAMNAAACRVLSEALWVAGERESAVTVLRRGQELHPRDFDLCFRLAVSLELLDPPEWRNAVAAYRIAHALEPERNEVLHRQGLALNELGRAEDAERIVRLLVAREPADLHWLQHLEELLQDQRKLEEAVATGRRMVEIDPDDVVANVSLGRALSAQGRFEEAIASFRNAVRNDPRNWRALSNLGIALSRHGETSEAETTLRSALEIEPESAQLWLSLGTALGLQKKSDEAIDCVRRAVAIEPRYWEAWFWLGGELGERGRIDEAIESFRRVVEIAPEKKEAHGFLGWRLAQQNRPEEALASVRRALELGSTSANDYNNLGATLWRQGKEAEAIDALERALESDPGHEEASLNLGFALWETERFDEAVAVYRSALELHPKSARLHSKLGDVLATQGRIDEALESFRAAEAILAEDATPAGRRERDAVRQAIGANEMLIAQRPRLEPVLAGQRPAASGSEWNDAVVWGIRMHRFREAVVLTEAALRDEPELIDEFPGGPNHAARAALLLAATRSAGLDDAERARLRGLARAWLLRSFESLRTAIAQTGPRAAEARFISSVAFTGPAFASVRGAALAALPEPERAEWEELWALIASGEMKK